MHTHPESRLSALVISYPHPESRSVGVGGSPNSTLRGRFVGVGLNSIALRCGPLYTAFKNYYTVAHNETGFSHIEWENINVAQKMHLVVLYLLAETDIQLPCLWNKNP